MTIEQSIRLRQAFDLRASEFLRALSGLATEEVEIALARVADQLVSTSEAEASLALAVRGRILKHYHDLRLSGTVTQASFGRKKLRREGVKKVVLVAAKNEYDSAMIEWGKANSEFQLVREEWIARRKRMPWIKRIFSQDFEPGPPEKISLASIVSDKMMRASYSSVSSELLIEFAATFELPPFPDLPENIEKSDILKLVG